MLKKTSLASLLLSLPIFCLADQKLPKWEFGLGPSIFHYPDYPGSKETNNLVLPFPYVSYRGDYITVDQREVKGALYQLDRMELDISLSGSIPVDSKDNQKRKGMDNLDGSVEVGPVFRYQLFRHDLNEFKFELPVRWVIASDFRSLHEEGWVTSPGFYYYYRDSFAKDQRIKITLGAAAHFGTAKYHNYFYGVDEEFETEDRSAYKATGGFSSMNYSLGLNWHIGQFWVGGFVKIRDLTQAVYKDSPLIETKQSETFAIAFTWNFMKSKQMVRGLE